VLVENFAAGDDEGARDSTRDPAEEAGSPATAAPREPRPIFSGLRSADHKYVELVGGEQAEAYDLDDDPQELDSVASCLTPGSRRQLADLLHAMAACRGEACRSLEMRALPAVETIAPSCPAQP
jgi:hypothetical protein